MPKVVDDFEAVVRVSAGPEHYDAEASGLAEETLLGSSQPSTRFEAE